MPRPHYRFPIDLSEKGLPPKRTKSFDMDAYVKLAEESVSYKPEEKAEFLKQSRTLAILIASLMGLNDGQYDLRVNRAGIAVSGEVTLHSETFYLQSSQGGFANRFMYRSCKGRKDYTGGMNRWMNWDALLDLPSAITEFRIVAGQFQ